MSWSESPQAFVRALKAPSDPPQPGEPLKIEVARHVWGRTDFYVPNKGQVILEWLLTKLLKERSNSGNSNPLLDPQYWDLLSDVLSPASSPQKANIKPHLLPLLNRTPLAPIVTSFWSLVPSAAPENRSTLISLVSKCLNVLWPIALPKFTAETLLECWSAFMGAFLVECGETDVDENMSKIGAMICESYRSALGNSSNKKKLYQTFTQTHLTVWLECVHKCDVSDTNSSILSAIYATGIETLFNLDILRQNISPSTSSADLLFSSLLDLVIASPRATLTVLPRLLASYTQAVRKHRSAIFGSGSNLGSAGLSGQVEKAGMRFFVLCDQVLERGVEQEEMVWEVRIRLLEVVETEGLFKLRGFSNNEMQEDVEGETVLRKNVLLAFTTLEWSSEEGLEMRRKLSQTNRAIECLSVLTRIEYDIVSPSISRIFRALLGLPLLISDTPISFDETEMQTEKLLMLLLSHHSKTRTLPFYIETLVSSFTIVSPLPSSFSPPSSTHNTAQLAYLAFHRSGPLTHTHLAALSKSLHAYLTPSQLGPVVGLMRSGMEDAQDAFGKSQAQDEGSDPEDADGKRKKRKFAASDEMQQTVNCRLEHLAIKYSLIAKIADAILPSLPLHTLPSAARQDVVQGIRDGMADALMHPAIDGLFWSRKSDNGKKLGEKGKKRKVKEGKHALQGWAQQIVGAAVLRFTYVLGTTVYYDSSWNALPEELVDWDERGERMLAAVRASLGSNESSDAMVPELVLEIFRTLLKSEMFEAPQEQIFDLILDYLDQYLTMDMAWSGLSAELDSEEEGRRRAGVALLHMVTDRWLGVFERRASAAQLTRLISTMTRPVTSGPVVSLEEEPVSELRPNLILLRTLRSAEFWELPRFRSAILSHFHGLTSQYDSFNISQLLSSLEQSKYAPDIAASMNGGGLQQAMAIYQFMLYAPPEYISRVSRGELLKRAMVLDLKTTITRTQSVRFDARARRQLLVLREFMSRVFRYLGTVEHEAIPEMIEYMVECNRGLADEEEDEGSDYTSVTLDLVEMHIHALLKLAQNGNDQHLLKTIHFLIPSHSLDAPVSETFQDDVLFQRTLLRFLDVVTSEFTISSFSMEICMSLTDLHRFWFFIVRQYLSEMILYRKGNAEDIVDARVFLEAWCRVLALGKWLETDIVAPELGRALVVNFLPSYGELYGKHGTAADSVCVAILSVLREEYRCLSQINHQQHLGVVLATYMAFYRIRVNTAIFEAPMSQTCKALSVPDFSHTLGLVLEFLSSAKAFPIDLTCLVHLSALLLREAPEGTLKLAQAHMTDSLNIFTNNEFFYRGPSSLRLTVLTFIAQQCSDKPAAVRAQDMNSLWSLISKVLAGSEKHDEDTDTVVFHQIVTTLSALIRLRRDLVLATLPHLGMVLRQLMMCIRTLRPHLGAKQSKLVTDTLPIWINSKQPLSAEESKALARLLTALTTKSVVRTHGSSREAQKAESLARPFSKHAAYVLKAYIDAMNDPLCMLPAETRRELQPGLFSLCDMLNEHSRDAMMVSALDAGGKTTMKALWKEYEKQRYVGKG